MIFSDRDNQRVRILINKGLRADIICTPLEISNAQQSGSQQADLNLPAFHHSQGSFTAAMIGACGFISKT